MTPASGLWEAGRRQGLRVAVAAAIFVIGCGTAGDGGLGGDDSAVTTPTAWVPSPDDYPADYESVTAMVLADGIVTQAELEQVILAVYACARDRGVAVAPEVKYGASGRIMSVGHGLHAASPGGLDSAEAVVSECSERLRQDEVWAVFDAQTPRRDSQEILAEVVTCMESRGVTFDDTDYASSDANLGPGDLSMLDPEAFDYCWWAAN